MPEPPTLDELRAAAVADCRRSMEAKARLGVTLDGAMGVAGHLVDAMEAGRSLIATMREVEAHASRQAATDAIRAYESARHRCRLRLVAVAIAEGASDADLCKLWKMSPEMVRRARRELARLDEQEAASAPAE